MSTKYHLTDKANIQDRTAASANAGCQPRGISLERALTAFAGFMVLLSVALTYWVHPYFVWLTVFVGANLFQQSFTVFCPATIIMRRGLGMKSEAELAIERKS